MIGTLIKVISTGSGRWRVQGESPDEVLARDLDKNSALAVARQISKERGAQLIVMGEDGRVEQAEEYDWGLADPETAGGNREATIPVVSVVQDDAGEWLVEGDAPDEILGRYTSKDQAIEFARPFASSRKGHLIVHPPEGGIEWTEDFACAEGER